MSKRDESPITVQIDDRAERFPAFRNEPPVDFAIGAAAMREALTDVKSKLGRSYPLVINGENVETRAEIVSRDPSDISQSVGNVAAAKPQHVLAAVSAGKRAASDWSSVGARRRAEFLHEAATAMRRRFELAAWQVYECGKQWREADADVCEAIDFCEYYAREMLRLARQLGSHLPGEDNPFVYEPRGVTVVIAPWNFPLAILCGMTAAALVTGNTVIMKPAEQSCVIAAKLMEIFHEVGIPPGCRQLPARHRRGDRPRLVGNPDVGADRLHRVSRAVGLRASSQKRRRACRARPGLRQARSSPKWAAKTRSSSMTTPIWTKQSSASSTRLRLSGAEVLRLLAVYRAGECL